MKAGFTYKCGDCGELLTHVTQGACSICGSHSVLPLGWFEISIRERKDWLQRIRGLRRGPRARSGRTFQEDEQEPVQK
jgi:hypothetical protein